MKKRRTFLGLFMLLSLAFVGVGYAALTNTLTVNGTLNATKNDENLNVQFIASQAIARTAGDTEDTSFTVTHGATDQTATVNVNGINEIGSYAEVYYVIKNNSESLVGDIKLDALVDTNLKITMATTDPETIPTDAADEDPNVFWGDHFKVEGSIVTTYDGFDLTPYGPIATDDEHGPTTGLDLDVGEVCLLVVKVTLVAPVLDTVPTHTFAITFNAKTVA